MEELQNSTKTELIEQIFSLQNKVDELEKKLTGAKKEELLKDIEEKYVDLLEENPAAMVIHTNGKIMYTNRSTNELIGVKNSDELVGKEVIEFVHPDSKENNLQHIEKLLKTQKPDEFSQEVFLKKDGTPFHVVIKRFPIEFKKKKAILIEFWDITKNKKIYEALKESKKHYKTLLDSIEASVFMLDTDLRYISGNKVLCERLEMKEVDILGKHITKILAERTANIFAENALKVLKDKKSISFDIGVNTSKGRSIYKVNLSPVFDDLNQITNILGISSDITKQISAENDLGYKNEKFQYLVEQADDAIFKGDSAGNFIYINPAAEFITGYKKKKLLTMNMSDLFSKDELSKKPLKYNLLDEGRSILMIRDIIISDGTTITVEMNSKKMLDGTYICIMRDISGRKM